MLVSKACSSLRGCQPNGLLVNLTKIYLIGLTLEVICRFADPSEKYEESHQQPVIFKKGKLAIKKHLIQDQFSRYAISSCLLL